ncbi:MAG: T9SS type A sorting domain-containing protein [Flavobacteriales bacterium]|nr:T9SS type A sorting domain-containing protein [Flavobacteriales bacterium]
MNKILLFIFCIAFISHHAFSQGICNPAGNIIIYSNYDGGSLTINIDDNVADIKIGLCSYEPLSVNITGTYAGNVTEVLWAGYTLDGTSVTGVDAGLVELLQYPPATLYDPDGNQNMVCAYECDTAFVPGGCNTVDQATDYFLTNLSGSLRYSYFQYGVWSGGNYNISDGGNCCVNPGCTAVVEAGGNVIICEGDSVQLAAMGATDYQWSVNDAVIDCELPCTDLVVYPTETTTYSVLGTDENGCTGTDAVSIVVNPAPEIGVFFDGIVIYASGGISYQWFQDGAPINGAVGNSYIPSQSGEYFVVGVGANGCVASSESISVVINAVSEMILNPGFSVFPNPADEVLHVSLNNTSIYYSTTASVCTAMFVANNISVDYSVMNSTGRILLSGSSNEISEYIFGMSTSSLPNGFYLLELNFEGTKSHLKFCVQH